MKRRQFLAALGALGLAPLASAQQPMPGLPASPSGRVLVELANFHCPRCRQLNDHFDRIHAAAAAQQMSFRFAPLAWEGQSLWPDRVYYAVRDLYPAAEGLVRDLMFDAIQREGQRFEELPQVMAYFERRQLPQRAKALVGTFDLLAVADRAATDVVLLSEMKAGRLADLSGATEVPVFVWVQDGEVVQAVSPADAQEAAPLVQKVIQKINEPRK